MKTKHTAAYSDPIEAKRNTCQTCGMLLDDQGEFHPYAFCVWKKQGLEPWQTLNWLLASLHRPQVGIVNVRDLHEKA